MAEVPAGVTTVTASVPVPAGLDTIIWEAVSLMKLMTVLVPKSTAAAPARLAPVIVTSVPPVVGPDAGLTPVTAGGLGGAMVTLTWKLSQVDSGGDPLSSAKTVIVTLAGAAAGVHEKAPVLRVVIEAPGGAPKREAVGQGPAGDGVGGRGG